jgi:glycerol-3-phosphate dehydrogenase
VSNAPLQSYDVFVIGGGVNGTGIARDASGRGYSVMLAEMSDLASGTSSAATKLVHGGLRYLEHYEFKLVHEALAEREVLWASAPHIIWPLRFVLPHHQGLRPAWLLRLGLFAYDNLGGRKLLPGTQTLDLTRHPAGKPLKPGFKQGFEYSDCWVDDARLVTLYAKDAAERGARIATRTKVISARRGEDGWSITLEGPAGRETVSASLVVNAAGPWVDEVINQALGRNDERHVRLVKGSHLVVNKLFEHDRCYIFQNADNRIIFAIPYEGDFTLIGTTDVDHDATSGPVEISAAETDYLLSAASEYFAQPVTREDVVWSFSGVRPLFDDGASAAQEATRDYVIRTEAEEGGALINVFGGKLTTSRHLAEEVVDGFGKLIGRMGPRWTKTAKLPGGDFAPTAFEPELGQLRQAYPWLEPSHARRLMRLYGTRARVLLGEAGALHDLGAHFGADLYGREVDYLMDEEWAVTAEDVLWRRTKLGLRLGAADKQALAAYMAARMQGEDT